MAEEFLQAGICAGPWWMMSSSKGIFGGCSPPIGDVGSFGWGADVVDIKPRPSCEESSITSASDGSMAFPSCQKPDSDSSGGDVLIDSTFPIMGFALSSSTTSDWNPSLLRASGRAEKYYNSTIHEEMNPRLNCHQETVMDSSQINNDWSPGDNYSSTNDFLLDQPKLNSVTSSGSRTAGFPVGSVSSVLLKSLFEPDHPQPQQPLFNNQSMNYMSNDQLSPSWPKLQPPLFRPSLPKQRQTAAAGGLHFSNNTTFWDATTAAALNDSRTNFLPSTQPQFLLPTFEEKARCPTLTTKTEEVRELAMMKKGRTEPAIKRPRIEGPSPLTTFKVRKEKLGDRITALQQLVSPFGKTDTASVLHEAIEYIKFLHDQVNVLSTPYMKQGAPIQHQQGTEKLRDLEQDLRSRGLCLVPISSTFPVANETTADFWTLTFGGLSGR